MISHPLSSPLSLSPYSPFDLFQLRCFSERDETIAHLNFLRRGGLKSIFPDARLSATIITPGCPYTPVSRSGRPCRGSRRNLDLFHLQV